MASLTYAECKQLFQDLKTLLAASQADLDSSRRDDLVRTLAGARFYEAGPWLLDGIDSLDADFRLACVQALGVQWQHDEPAFVDKLCHMAQDDPDNRVRQAAIDSLGLARIRYALPVLKKVVGDGNLHLQKQAYLAILRILNRAPEDIAACEVCSEPIPVDWDLVNSIP